MFLVPLVLFITFAIVQIGVYIHTGNVATAAAQAAYEDARLYGSTGSAGSATGYAVLDQSGGMLENATVSVNRGPAQINVTVTGDAPAIVPGLPLHIERTVTGPTERWVP